MFQLFHKNNFTRIFKYFLVTLGILFLEPAFAGKYTQFGCGTKDVNIEDCEQCEIKKDIEVEYLLNKSQRIVMSKTYKNDANKKTIVGSVTFENCKIFDEDNWDCSNSTAYFGGTAFLLNDILMVDGNFISKNKACSIKSSKMECNTLFSYCRIKK